MIVSKMFSTAVFTLNIACLIFGLGDVFEYTDTVFGLVFAIRRYATMGNLRAALLVASIYISSSKPTITDAAQKNIFIQH